MHTVVPVIALDHPAAFDAARVGRTAATLARARAAGLPVGSGVVLTTQWCREDRVTADQVWRIISHDGAVPLVVRPSAVGRDRGADSAGAIAETTVVDDAADLLAAIDDLRHGTRRSEANLPVLVQPHVASDWRGVLFADDERTGSRSRAIVAATSGPNEWIAELDRAGRVVDVVSGQHLDRPPAEVLTRLVRLAQRVATAFGGAHDIEWAADVAGAMHLTRVHPVVRLRTATDTGPRATARCARRLAQMVFADEPAA